MKYNFNIILNGQMEANTEQELVEKLALMINRNPVFQQIEQAFDIRIDRQSILSEEDDIVFDVIASDFDVKKEEMIEDFYGLKIEREIMTHEIAVDGTGSPTDFEDYKNA